MNTFTTSFRTNGSAALQPQHTGRSNKNFRIVQGGSSITNPYLGAANCRKIQLAQHGAMSNAQILATEVCIVATSLLVFVMWFLLR